jgi:predicted CXXCH cytochrome family protein
MRWRLTLLGVVAVAVLVGAHALAGGQQNPYRLKDPNQTKICLGCHADFEQKLKKPVVHAAVQAGECSSCHDPHVSSHQKLLSSDLRELCGGCHDSVIPEKAKSLHKPVVDGECAKCHDPHASDNPALLLKKREDLCFSCHKAVGDAIASAKFKHSAVQKGCDTCHAAHGSDQSSLLLKKAVPAICVDCHKPDGASFIARHQKYPVGKAACTTCHDPHGSNQPALLWNTVHSPLSAGGCNRCHQAADSATPFATKSTGFELCKACHADMVNAALSKRRLHGPMADQKGCVNCHNPHASDQAKLLKKDTQELCRSCHPDTLKRIASTPVKHVPVEQGMCISCHSPHASDSAYLIDQPTIMKVCGQCHDYQTHSAHPVGEKAVDPRNKNLTVDCLSCHKAHGTEFKRMLLAETNVELCTRCHKKFVR